MDIRLCGELVVELDGRRVERQLPGRQGRLLIAFLALAERPVSRDEAIAVLWGRDASPDRARALNVVLSRTRAALGGSRLLQTPDRSSLQLCGPLAVDVLTARSLVETARSALAAGDAAAAQHEAEQARHVLARPLLPGHEAEWLEDERRRTCELALDALELLAEAALATGGPGLATAERSARQLIEAAGLRETGWTLLIRALAAQGNSAEALCAYEELRRKTLDELGVAPAPHVVALHEQLLAGTLRKEQPAAEPAPRERPGPAADEALPAFSTRRSSPFVGRSEELARLTAALRRTMAGRREIVRLVGEPGIGKTRLAVEFAGASAAMGARVLYGRCDFESLVPYQPLVEALNHHIAYTPDAQLSEHLGPHGAELTRLLPQLSARRLDLGAPVRDDAETQRYRLFEAVSHLLEAAARDRPTVLILDDLQWADRPTLLLLRQVMRGAQDGALLILAIYRENELVRSHPLLALFADLRRERVFDHVGLAGLGEDASSELMTSVGRREVTHRVRRALWEDTGGNPFFLEEMVRHLADRPGTADGADGDGWGALRDLPLPDEVRDVIGRRLDQLPQTLVRVLQAAAVIGREFSLTVLADVVDQPGEPLDELLETGCEAQIVEELPGPAVGRYNFTHSLIRQALLESCSTARKARTHLRIGEAIERRFGDSVDDRLAELAHHFVEARTEESRERAVDYSMRAAERAGKALAYEEAARLYATALTAASGAGVEERGRYELLASLGRAQLKAGEVQSARTTWRRAAELARAFEDPDALAEAALGYGAAGHMQGGVVDRFMVELLEEGLQALGPEDSALRARLLGRLAVELRFTDESERRYALIDDALEVARRVGSARTLGIVLGQRHWALWGPENLPERLTAANDLLALASERHDDTLALQAHRWRLADLLELGDIGAVDGELDAYARLARDRHLPSELWYVPLLRAMRTLLSGEFAAAEQHMRESNDLGQRVQADNATQAWVLQLLVLRREQGRLAELEELVRAQRERYGTIVGWRAVTAYVDAELGHHDAARAGLAALADGGFAKLPRDGLWLGALAFLAEAAVRCDEPAHAAPLYRLLLPYRERNVGIAWLATCLGSASRVLGLLAAALADWDAAAAHFERALAMNRRMHAHPWVARTQVDFARMLLARPDADDHEYAARLIDAATAAARSMSMRALVQEADELRLREPAAR